MAVSEKGTGQGQRPASSNPASLHCRVWGQGLGSSNTPFPPLQGHSWTTCPPGRKSISTVGADSHAGAGAEGHVLCSAAQGRAFQPSSPPGPSSLINLTLVVSSMWFCVVSSSSPSALLFSPSHHSCSSSHLPGRKPLQSAPCHRAEGLYQVQGAAVSLLQHGSPFASAA